MKLNFNYIEHIFVYKHLGVAALNSFAVNALNTNPLRKMFAERHQEQWNLATVGPKYISNEQDHMK